LATAPWSPTCHPANRDVVSSWASVPFSLAHLPFVVVSLLQLQRPGQVKYRGVWHALVTIFKEEGFYGYLRGNGTNIIRIFPYSAVQFAAYEQFKKVPLLLPLFVLWRRSSSYPWSCPRALSLTCVITHPGFLAAVVEGEEGFRTTSIFERRRWRWHHVRGRHVSAGPHPHSTQLWRRCRQAVQR
jgi:hypothetical protein